MWPWYDTKAANTLGANFSFCNPLTGGLAANTGTMRSSLAGPAINTTLTMLAWTKATDCYVAVPRW